MEYITENLQTRIYGEYDAVIVGGGYRGASSVD